MKQGLIAALLIGIASVLAHLHVVAQSYYPVVQVASPEGLLFTAVHDPMNERSHCGAANADFLAPFKALCRDCKVVSARCERSLEGLEAALNGGKAIPHHQVSAPGVHLAIAGPEEAARFACDHIARAASLQDARCLPPAKGVKY